MTTMSNIAIDQYIKEIESFGKELLSDSQKAKEFWVETGIYDENGNLTEQYQSE